MSKEINDARLIKMEELFNTNLEAMERLAIMKRHRKENGKLTKTDIYILFYAAVRQEYISAEYDSEGEFKK